MRCHRRFDFFLFCAKPTTITFFFPLSGAYAWFFESTQTGDKKKIFFLTLGEHEMEPTVWMCSAEIVDGMEEMDDDDYDV